MLKIILASLCAAVPALAAPALAQRGRPDTAAMLVAPPPPRASWLSDRRSFAVGDVLTVVVDEQTTASETTNRNSSSTRGQNNKLNFASGSGVPTTAAFTTGQDASSQESGVSGRQGQLSATLSVRIMQLNHDGSLKIVGQRVVTVDGRKQQMTLTGAVRPEDISAQNVVLSSRVADAAISYKGNGIGPHRGLLGSILGIFWP